MNPTTKTILIVAGVGALAVIGYAVYRKMNSTAIAPKVTPIPSVASSTAGTNNSLHDVADLINAGAGLYRSVVPDSEA